MSVLYHFHLFDAFLHIFGEMRERRILTKLSTHFSKKVPKICARFLAKSGSQKKNGHMQIESKFLVTKNSCQKKYLQNFAVVYMIYGL